MSRAPEPDLIFISLTLSTMFLAITALTIVLFAF
jgi:hypothetical protein